MTDPSGLIPFEWYSKFTLSDVGLPVIEAGASGMQGQRGILVPSAHRPGSLSVLWLEEMDGGKHGPRGRMQTSVTEGTVPDATTRAGFLFLVDFAEDQNIWTTLGWASDLRDLPSWIDPEARSEMIESLTGGLSGTVK